ncbi:hypothetical protein [Mycolicibacterium mengxianglii]|uniref:hypothetical protein n=1 Tax=Mycolicibacterium mengxianglii TaxID=2736649 RepID=UPI0018D0340D|nr:hypothetical protein [Mycolicibacterium mengxianglii]
MSNPGTGIWNTPEREQLRKTVRGLVDQEIFPHVRGEILTALAAKTLGYQP